MPAAPPATILVVDDELMNLSLNGTVLRLSGYRILLAEDGAEAVQVYRDRHAEIDLVFMDLSMPKVTGPEAVEQMVAISPAVKVLLTSGQPAPYDLKLDWPQIKGFLRKPYGPTTLLGLIRECLGHADRTTGPRA